jgi:ribose transport system ATP-binding protein
MQGIVKTFPGICALDHVDFNVRSGEVHALIGENGAGKSTLMNVLAGLFHDYQGCITFAGQPVKIINPRQGLELGIAVIYQELNVLPNFSVAENIMLGEERAGRWTRKMYRGFINEKAREIIDHLGFDLDPDESVSRLSRARQCLVEIAGAVRRNAKLLVFDEPTASLGSEDVEKLFRVIKKLRDKGLGIVYISHRLAELPGIADRVTVLRDGRAVGTKALAECKVSDLTRMMLGHELAEVFPEKTNQPGPTILKVEGLSRKGMFENISFELRQGEILGIAGLVGSGRTEIARAVFGADKASGNVEFLGTNVTKNNPSQSRKLGIAMIPEDRKLQGNITGRPIGENLNISILDKLAGYLGFQSPRKLHDRAMYMIDRMEIEPGLPGTNIQNLSGGNQQKVVVGRWLALDSKVIIFDEPTQGIDMGTKSQIYNLIMDLACKGQGIILISSELLEIAKLADRILIIRDGRLTDELKGKGIDEDNLFAACAGKSKSQ